MASHADGGRTGRLRRNGEWHRMQTEGELAVFAETVSGIACRRRENWPSSQKR